MKKIVFCNIFFSILLGSIYAQNYDSLVVENAQWRVEYIDANTPWPDTMFGWLIRGDTIINNTFYKKVFRRKFADVYSNVVTEQILHGVIREDIENKSIYAIEMNSIACELVGSEFLLFDFSQDLGDSLYLCSISGMDPPILNDIYYSFLFGKDRKIFSYDPSPVQNFIEGIGSFAGLFENPMINVSSETGYSLFDYCRGSDEQCGILFVSLNILSNIPPITIYPNPARGLFYVKSLRNRIDQISIYSIYGQECQNTLTRFDDKLIKIETNYNGLLLLRIVSDHIEYYLIILSAI